MLLQQTNQLQVSQKLKPDALNKQIPSAKLCPKCSKNTEQHLSSGKVIFHSQMIENTASKSLPDISDYFCICQKNKQNNEKRTFQKILQLLKIERIQRNQFKQSKKKASIKLWHTFGSLLGLEKEKFNEVYVFQKLEDKNEAMFKELMNKNGINRKIINAYTKKTELTSTKLKISHKLSVDIIPIDDIKIMKTMPTSCENLKDKKQSFHKKLKKTINYTIRCKSKPTTPIYSLRKKSDAQNQQISSKAQSSIKQINKQQKGGKRVLNNITFDPDTMLTSYKCRFVGKTNERHFLHYLQKTNKSNKLLMRVGGIRFSLQDYNSQLKRQIS